MQGRKSSQSVSDIHEIARAANVSIATVSRVMNGSKPVSNELRERVERTIREFGYKPNQAARSLGSQKTRTIGLVIPDESGGYHQAVVSGITEMLSKSGYDILISSVRHNHSNEVRYLDLFTRRMVDGIIFMEESQDPRVRKSLRSLPLPVVLAAVTIPGVGRPSVGIDDYAAARDATSYLLGLGHRNIGFIAGSGLSVGSLRRRGYEDALAEATADRVAPRVEAGDYTYRSGYLAAARLLDNYPGISAIFATSDDMAVGALRLLHERSLRVPRDISLIGFDDIEITQYTSPAITTVHQPIREIGIEAARLVISILHDQQVPRSKIVVAHTIVERESCGPVE